MRMLKLDELSAYVGQELCVSDWMMIDQARIDSFAEVTEDHQWIHVDRERAQRELGSTIAHGFLTLSLLSTLTMRSLAILGVGRALNYGFNKVRFLNPVPVDASVRLRETLLAVERKGEGWLVTRSCTVELKSAEKPAIAAEWIALLYPA